MNIYDECAAALEALPEKKLACAQLYCNGNFCAVGTLLHSREFESHFLQRMDDSDIGMLSELIREPREDIERIMTMNDEAEDITTGEYVANVTNETPELRYERMLTWLKEKGSDR